VLEILNSDQFSYFTSPKSTESFQKTGVDISLIQIGHDMTKSSSNDFGVQSSIKGHFQGNMQAANKHERK
jgi:hypothetical protein